MLVIGHRGAARLAPENTIEALRAGVAAGADVLEFDVRLTKDDVPVILHDSTTLRTHKRRVVISRYTHAELVAMDLSPAIPTLREVLDEFFGVILLNIELKSRGSGPIVVKLIAQEYATTRDEWQNVLISSFSGLELLRIRRANKQIPLAYLHDQNPFLFIAYERWLHLSAVGFHRLYVNPLAIAIARRIGLFCYAYTVDRTYGALVLKDLDIEGVVTNRPDILVKGLAEQKKRP